MVAEMYCAPGHDQGLRVLPRASSEVHDFSRQVGHVEESSRASPCHPTWIFFPLAV